MKRTKMLEVEQTLKSKSATKKGIVVRPKLSGKNEQRANLMFSMTLHSLAAVP